MTWCLGEDLGGWTDTCKPLNRGLSRPFRLLWANPTASDDAEAELIYFILFPRVSTQDLPLSNPLIMGFPGGAVEKNPPANAGHSG